MLKVGIIGRGNIAKVHEAAYSRICKENGPVEIAAYCDIRKEQLSGIENARTYTDIETFIKNEKGRLDYVDICLPTYLHAEVAVMAMRAGFNVMCEKPMALDYEQTQAMNRTAKETNRLLMIAHCTRFMGAAQIAREYCRNNELGKVRNAEFRREGGSVKPMGYNNWFRKRELSGGAMLDLHVHDVDLIYWMFGMPKSVSVAASILIPGSGYDALSANYMYDNGLFVNASCDWTIAYDKFNTRSFRINFEKGYIYLDRTPNRNVFVKVSIDGKVVDLWDRVESDSMYYNEIMYFADCLINGRAVENCPPEESAEAIRLVMAEMQSADQYGGKILL